MPAPFTPPIIQRLIAIETAITNLQATIAEQAEDLERTANFQRYMLESTFGSNADITGIWDGTDRYPDV